MKYPMELRIFHRYLIDDLELLTGPSVSVAVKVVDVLSDHLNRSTHIRRTVSTSACTINITGNRYTSAVVRVTVS